MIYEVRTYTLRPGTLAEFEERYEKRLPLREKHSKLGAFWHTEFGPLNQVVHVYPYDDLQHRTRVRAAMAQDAARNALPGGQDLIVAQEAEIMNPAPFMRPLGSRDHGTGNVYEMRTYTYAPGDIPKVLDAWGKAIEAREKFSPLGGLLDERARRAQQIHPHLGVQGSGRAHPRPRGIPPPRRRMAATGRRPPGPPGKQAADPGDLLAGAVVGTLAAALDRLSRTAQGCPGNEGDCRVVLFAQRWIPIGRAWPGHPRLLAAR